MNKQHEKWEETIRDEFGEAGVQRWCELLIAEKARCSARLV